MQRNLLILAVPSFSLPLGIMLALSPGIMLTTWLRGPMLSTD